MIVLIILLLFVVAIDLFIMACIFDWIKKDVKKTVDPVEKMIDDFDQIFSEYDGLTERIQNVSNRVFNLECLIGGNKKRQEEVPFPPEEEVPTDDVYEPFYDFSGGGSSC